MSLERIFHCPECDTHGSSDHPGWLILTDREGPRRHFCNEDCLLKFAAKSEPPEQIEMGDA